MSTIRKFFNKPITVGMVLLAIAVGIFFIYTATTTDASSIGNRGNTNVNADDDATTTTTSGVVLADPDDDADDDADDSNIQPTVGSNANDPTDDTDADSDDNADDTDDSTTTTTIAQATTSAVTANNAVLANASAGGTTTDADFDALIKSAEDSALSLNNMLNASTTAERLRTAVIAPRVQLTQLLDYIQGKVDGVTVPANVKTRMSTVVGTLSTAIEAVEAKALEVERKDNGYRNLLYAAGSTSVWPQFVPLPPSVTNAFSKISDAPTTVGANRTRVTFWGYGDEDNHYPSWFKLDNITTNRPLDQDVRGSINGVSFSGRFDTMSSGQVAAASEASTTNTVYNIFFEQFLKDKKAPKTSLSTLTKQPEVFWAWPQILWIAPQKEELDINYIMMLDPWTKGDGWKTYKSFDVNPYNPLDKGDDPIATDPYLRTLSNSAMRNSKARVGMFISGPVGLTATIDIFDNAGKLIHTRYIPLTPLQYAGGGSTHLKSSDLDQTLYINHGNISQWGAEAWTNEVLGKSMPGSLFNQIVVVEPDFDGFINVRIEGIQVGDAVQLWYGDVILP